MNLTNEVLNAVLKEWQRVCIEVGTKSDYCSDCPLRQACQPIIGSIPEEWTLPEVSE